MSADAKEVMPGAEIVLGTDLENDAGVAANAEDTIRIRVLDEDYAVIVDVTETIGALTLIENPSVGRYQYRHTATSSDRTEDHAHQHEWTAVSTTTPGAPNTVGKPRVFYVLATDFPP